MERNEILGILPDLETYLTGCQRNAAPGSKAQTRFDEWRRAVNSARAAIIAQMCEEDDGK